MHFTSLCNMGFTIDDPSFNRVPRTFHSLADKSLVYKRPPHFPSNRALTAVSPLSAAPLPPPPERRLLRPSPSQPAPLAHSLGPIELPRTAPCQPRAASSPERVVQRPEPVGAAAHPRRSPDHAVQPR
jgi:hypothetical protein